MLIDQMGNNWRVNQLLYADDTVLLEYSKENLQHLLNVFDNVCERRKLKEFKRGILILEISFCRLNLRKFQSGWRLKAFLFQILFRIDVRANGCECAPCLRYSVR